MCSSEARDGYGHGFGFVEHSTSSALFLKSRIEARVLQAVSRGGIRVPESVGVARNHGRHGIKHQA